MDIASIYVIRLIFRKSLENIFLVFKFNSRMYADSVVAKLLQFDIASVLVSHSQASMVEKLSYMNNLRIVDTFGYVCYIWVSNSYITLI